MNVLYVGNKLAVHGGALTGIEILGPLLEASGYKLRYASSQRNKARRLAEMLLATFKNRKWAHFVLIDTYSTSNFWYAVAVAGLCRIFKVPYVPILHGGNLPFRLVHSPRASASLFGGARINVAPSGYLKKAFADAGFRVRAVPNPISTDKFPFKNREVAAPKLLWVRALGPMSNPAMAIRTLAEITKAHPYATMAMVGPDKAGITPELRQMADALGVKVQFTGSLSQAQWSGLSTEFDIFINTSTVDNAPFSLVEAMSLGLFVVSTDVGGIPFVAADGADAVLVPANDHIAMAAAVLRIMGDSGLRKKLQIGAREKSHRFSPEAVIPKWDEILQGAL